MAKTFFENFKEAARIVPAFYKSPYEEANLPSLSENNSAAWRERVAVPFSYMNSDTKGNQTKQTGILYLPSYEATKIRGNGTVKSSKDPIEIYGAEINGQSLTKDGFLDIFNDYANSDFKFDMQTATRALKNATGEKKLGARASTATPFKANVNNFISNLRSNLWGL